jgi:imidazolonepropionase-like amidohydrolase
MTATSVAAGATRTARRQNIAAQNLERLHDAGVTVAMGTDAGNPLTLHGPSVYAEMEAMQAAGLTPTEVLVTATRGGATAMGRQEDLGTIEAGKIADLVILKADPTADIANMRQLRYVVRGGVLRSIDELRASN